MGHDEELTEDQIDGNISTFHGAVKRTWDSFCATSSIHGLKYTRDEDTNNIVRFVWVLISVVMFSCAILMVHTIYIEYRSNPTRMNVENDHVPVTSIYFPPVTICPEVLFNMQQSRSYLQTLRLPVTVDRIMTLLRLFYGFMVDDESYDLPDIQIMESVLQLNNLTLEQLVRRLHWSCDDILYRCRFQGKIVNCGHLFQLSQSFFGHCCSFNLKQHGLLFTARTAAPGLGYGLSLVLRYNDDSYDMLQSFSHGFKLLMQEAQTFPSAHSVSKFIALNTEAFITVRPEEVFCSEDVKGLPREERSCIFGHEVDLRYFPPVYMSTNCELNCRVTRMLKFCGCFSYFFNLNFTNEPICSFKDIPCLVDNFADIVTRKRKAQCHCPVNCEHFDYDVQVSNVDLQLKAPTIDPFYEGLEDGDAIAHIFINSQVYRRVRHDLLSNMVTLVSNLGSAFSLFVGMSLLSVVEIIYYASVILHKNYLLELEARDKFHLFKKNPNPGGSTKTTKKSPFIIHKS